MALWKGEFALTEDQKQDVEVDSWGVASGTLYYWGPFPLAVGFMVGLVNHPDYPWLYRKKGTVSRSAGDYADVRITFEGVPPETEQYSYRTTGATSTEPIETNPNFSTLVGSVTRGQLTGLLGSTFDAQGKFLGFTDYTNADMGAKKVGIKSYLAGSLNYEQTLITGNLGDSDSVFSNLGYIDSPDSSNVLPHITDTRNWLLASGSAEQIGIYALGATGGKISKQWKLSAAAKPWDSDFYSPPAP